MTRPIFIDLNPNKPYYYAYMVCLDRCNENSNTFDDASCKICVLKKNLRCKFKCIWYDNRNKRINKYK